MDHTYVPLEWMKMIETQGHMSYILMFKCFEEILHSLITRNLIIYNNIKNITNLSLDIHMCILGIWIITYVNENILLEKLKTN